MRKINWRMLNIAFWIEVVLCYVLPFKIVDNFKYKVGFPIPFITVYDTVIEANPLMSMHLNPLGLLINGVFIYLIALFAQKVYRKFRNSPVK